MNKEVYLFRHLKVTLILAFIKVLKKTHILMIKD